MVGRSRTSLANDCGDCVTSISTTWATSSGCSIRRGISCLRAAKAPCSSIPDRSLTRGCCGCAAPPQRNRSSPFNPHFEAAYAAPLGRAFFARQRRDVDDVSALAFDHERSQCVDHVEDSPQVGIEDAIPILDRQAGAEETRSPPIPALFTRMSTRPNFFSTCSAKALHRLLGRHIAGNRLGSVPGLDNRSDSLIERRRGPSGHQHRSSHSSPACGRSRRQCRVPRQ